MSKCCPCCNRITGKCRKCAEPCLSFLKCLENLPGIGHIVAACYACAKQKAKAERAGLKATVGLLLGILNFPIEIVDESARNRSVKMYSHGLQWRSGWMKDYGQLSLAQLCLPASHQSATYSVHKKLKAVPLVDGWSCCQDVSIREQLNGGIRFLDLRIMNYEKDIWTHHNLIVCIKFTDILNDVKTFLDENPSEIVGIYVDNDGKDLDWSRCIQILEEVFKDRFIFEHMREQPIDNYRSRKQQLAVFGLENAHFSWKSMKYRWVNRSSPQEISQDLSAIIDEMGTRRPYYPYWYKAEATPNKFTIIRSLGGIPGISVQSCTTEKFDFLDDLAYATNHAVFQVLENVQQLPFHIFSTDYVHDDIIGKIIETNSKVRSNISIGRTNLSDQQQFNDRASTLSTGSSFEIGPSKVAPVQIWETSM